MTGISIASIPGSDPTGVQDSSAAVQQAIDQSRLSGETILWDGKFRVDTGVSLTEADHSLQIIGYGATKNLASSRSALICDYVAAVRIHGAHGVRISGLHILSGPNGTGGCGVSMRGAQHCVLDNVFVDGFATGILLITTMRASCIYNRVSGGGAIRCQTGLKLSGSFETKVVNQNVFTNCYLGNNGVGVIEQNICNDNAFIGLEVGNCATGLSLSGVTWISSANIEKCTVGMELKGDASVTGSARFSGNSQDIINNDDCPYLVDDGSKVRCGGARSVGCELDGDFAVGATFAELPWSRVEGSTRWSSVSSPTKLTVPFGIRGPVRISGVVLFPPTMGSPVAALHVEVNGILARGGVTKRELGSAGTAIPIPNVVVDAMPGDVITVSAYSAIPLTLYSANSVTSIDVRLGG